MWGYQPLRQLEYDSRGGKDKRVKPQLDMSEAIDCWLVARELWVCARIYGDELGRFHCPETNVRLCLERFNNATDALYAAFVEDFSDLKVASDAFFKFHKVLAEQQDSGSPRRAKLHPTPVLTGHA